MHLEHDFTLIINGYLKSLL